MLKLDSVMICSDNPKKLVSFYKDVFGADPAWEGGDFSAFMTGASGIVIGPHDKVKGKSKNPERYMINYSIPEKMFKKEVDRVKKIKGAKLIQKPYRPDEEGSMWIATFADPDGNYFQIVTPWE